MSRFWPQRFRVSRRRFLKFAGVGTGLTAVAGIYAWRIEPHWLEVVERDLPIANLPRRLIGARLAQLSDIHIGPQVDDEYLTGVFDLVRSIAPEIVVYTGDFATCVPRVNEQIRRMLSKLVLGTKATFGVLGNHDFGPDWVAEDVGTQIASIAGESGVRMLRNEVGDIDGLQVAGCDDIWSGNFDVRSTIVQLDAMRPAIVLSHNPDSADYDGWDSYHGWILCGHTHGGQCKPPFLPPPLLPVENRRYTAGEFELTGERHMYINRGVGHLLQARFNSRPEVTLFRLTTPA